MVHPSRGVRSHRSRGQDNAMRLARPSGPSPTINRRNGGNASPVPSLLSGAGGTTASHPSQDRTSPADSRPGMRRIARVGTSSCPRWRRGRPRFFLSPPGLAFFSSLSPPPPPSNAFRFRDGIVTGSAVLLSFWPGRGSTPGGVSSAALPSPLFRTAVSSRKRWLACSQSMSVGLAP